MNYCMDYRVYCLDKKFQAYNVLIKSILYFTNQTDECKKEAMKLWLGEWGRGFDRQNKLAASSLNLSSE
jgi:hypothetical protein